MDNSSSENGSIPNQESSVDADGLSTRAKDHLRAFARFYLWAIPLFELGHVNIKNDVISLDLMAAKRFMVGYSRDGTPIVEVQQPEMVWMEHIPWAYVGVHFNSGRLLFVAKPESPLKMVTFVLPVDIKEKLKPFEGKRFVDISSATLFGRPVHGKRIRLELKTLEEGFFGKKKTKLKMKGAG